jgi:hypothetical protein
LTLILKPSHTLEDRLSEMIFISRGLDLIAEKGIRETNESVSAKVC